MLNRSPIAALVTLVLAAFPALASAAADEHAAAGAAKPDVMAFDLLQFGMAIAVFLIAFFILRTAVWPKILGGLEAREGKIRSEVFAAEELRKTAAKEKADFERALAEARTEAQRMIEQTKAEQLRLAADLKARAETELTELREQARLSIDAAKRAAISDIYSHAATLATNVASKILQREVNPDDQRRLVEESVGQMDRQYARN
ncbi:MAG: F0F1 ATP synthase subunit B [Planctomycetota bacterium]|nr:F0F1 ATP synthase subunit B [Planctomycetota bacterium]